MTEQIYHIPVLFEAAISALAPERGGIYVDATLGGGGHSRGIVEHLPEGARLYGIDQDADAIAHAFEHSRFTAIHGNFRFLANFMKYFGHAGNVNGILADLGVSSHHFDEASRGFSFRSDAPLDMRMNQSAPLTAARLLQELPQERLSEIFRLYGELRQSQRLAAAIVSARAKGAVNTTGDLARIVTPLLNPAAQKKELARVFQALRIEVNGEMQALQQFLESSLHTLCPGGRLVIITYHSLEDRLVKNFMRSGRCDGKVEPDIYGRTSVPFKTLGKPIVPDADELAANPRSRSAKLRVAVKL